VAVNESARLIGQIVLYRTNIITESDVISELLLSPLSVHPAYFRQGVATKLMEEGFKRAKELGYNAVFLCGNPLFYHKFGFKGSYHYQIYHEQDETKKAEWCMALELTENGLAGKGGTISIQ